MKPNKKTTIIDDTDQGDVFYSVSIFQKIVSIIRGDKESLNGIKGSFKERLLTAVSEELSIEGDLEVTHFNGAIDISGRKYANIEIGYKETFQFAKRIKVDLHVIHVY